MDGGQRTGIGERLDDEVAPLGKEGKMEEGCGRAGDEALKAGVEYV